MNCRADRWYDHTNMKQVHVRSCPLFTTDAMTSCNLSLLLSYTSWAVQIPSRQLPRISITEETRKAFSVNSKMEAILDIIFKAYSHSIISLEDFTATISRSIEGKKAETLKLSCRYFFIQSPNSCIVVVCVCVCIHLWCYSPFWALASHRWCLHSCLVFRSWYACVCVCVSTTFRFGCAKCWNHIVSVYTRSATLLLYHTSNTICNGAGIKKKLKPMHKYWQWSILQFCNINKKPNHNVCVCVCVCMHVFCVCVCVHTYIHSVSKNMFASTFTYSGTLPVCILHEKSTAYIVHYTS